MGYVASYALSALLSMLFMAIYAATSLTRMAYASGSGSVQFNVTSFYWNPVLTMVVSLVLIWIFHRQGLRRLEAVAAET